MEAVIESSRREQAEPDAGPDIQALQELSKSWTADEWESHLQSLEVGLAEYLPSTPEILRRGLAANIFDLSEGDVPEQLSKSIENLISQLRETQRFVIKKIYWDGMTGPQIARMMGISRQRVFTIKRQALRKLAKIARKAVVKFPLVGTTLNFDSRVGRNSRLEINRETQEQIIDQGGNHGE